MRRYTWQRWLALWRRRLRAGAFWLLVLGLAAILAVLGAMAWVAVAQHDAFLRLRPLICAEGLQDRQYLVVAMVSPLCAVFALVAAGELLAQRAAARRARRVRWRHFWLYAVLMLAAGALVLFALRC